ncbi:unnamed protein product, partial [Candidula unifasciata]
AGSSRPQRCLRQDAPPLHDSEPQQPLLQRYLCLCGFLFNLQHHVCRPGPHRDRRRQ